MCTIMAPFANRLYEISYSGYAFLLSFLGGVVLIASAFIPLNICSIVILFLLFVKSRGYH